MYKDTGLHLGALRIVLTVWQLIYVGTTLYATTMMVMKSSILKEWIRIFVTRGRHGPFYWTCYALIFVTVMFNSSVIIATSVSCSPRVKIWDKTIQGHCIDPKITLIISAVINVILDLFILLLPQRIIWSLHTTKKKKVGVSLVFTMGVLYVAFNRPFSIVSLPAL